MKNKKMLICFFSAFLTVVVLFATVVICANDSGEIAGASAPTDVTNSFEDEHTVLEKAAVVSTQATPTSLTDVSYPENDVSTVPAVEVAETKPHTTVKHVEKTMTAPAEPTKPTATATNGSEETVTEALVTEKQVAWGTDKDFDAKSVQKEANRYVSTFEGVEVDDTLNVNNCCWTLVVSSYNSGPEEKLLSRIKDSARFQYEKCAANGYLDCDVPFRMYIEVVPSYNDKLNATYYEYYILYML